MSDNPDRGVSGEGNADGAGQVDLRDRVYRLWKPHDVFWARWVKPVLLAHVQPSTAPRIEPPPEWLKMELFAPLFSVTAGSPYRRGAEALRDVAIVVDLPHAAAVPVGVGLAHLGFRPVPLYNALPDVAEIVDQRAILAALVAGAELLGEIPESAPPAFLLDAKRSWERIPAEPPVFDNRWVCSPWDFPSPDVLWERGIRRVVVIHGGAARVAWDLANVLVPWKERGIVFFHTPSGAPELAPFHVRKPSIFEQIQAFFLRLALRKNGDPFGRRLYETSWDFGGGVGGGLSGGGFG
ncbi:MAG: hypothetical protein U0441_27850 [Polyangiaceae bacterium]